MPGSHYWVRIGQGRAVWQVHFVPCPVPIVRIGLTCDWNLEEESIVGFEIDVSSLKKDFSHLKVVPDLHYRIRIG